MYERDTGELMGASDAELLHEVVRLRNALEAERLRSYELSLELTRERSHRLAIEALTLTPCPGCGQQGNRQHATDCRVGGLLRRAQA